MQNANRRSSKGRFLSIIMNGARVPESVRKEKAMSGVLTLTLAGEQGLLHFTVRTANAPVPFGRKYRTVHFSPQNCTTSLEPGAEIV
jgi:ADP-glucose pyrophosphorylase